MKTTDTDSSNVTSSFLLSNSNLMGTAHSIDPIITDMIADFRLPLESKACSPSSVATAFSEGKSESHHVGKKSINRGNYRCGRCGQLKSNHICEAVEGTSIMYNMEVQTNTNEILLNPNFIDLNLVSTATSPRGNIANRSFAALDSSLQKSVFVLLEKIHGKERVIAVSGSHDNLNNNSNVRDHTIPSPE